ncbi:DDE-type integrase/transposase/recombinase [Acetobacter persici]|uniref:DDE-type integrase/transposase/recombinase n=1 Tax=Acetobacter persici TaxID=1076596 RepID=UPI0015C51A10
MASNSAHGHAIEPNLLRQHFSATTINKKWTANITCLWTCEGLVYLSVVLDLFPRRSIGWNPDAYMTAKLEVTALKRAIALRQPPGGCVHHADCGRQNCSKDYLKALFVNSFTLSMSRKRHCWNNAVTESFSRL